VCLDYSKKLHRVCFGGKDHRVTIWDLKQQPLESTTVLKTPTYILYGHEETVKCLKIIEESSVIVSVDKVILLIIKVERKSLNSCHMFRGVLEGD
jgi:hypothetical protein